VIDTEAVAGARVQQVRPDGELWDARGVIVHRSGGGALVRWDAPAQPSETWVPAISWLVSEEEAPAESPLTITAHELTLIRKLLVKQAERVRADAPAVVARQPHRLVREAMADIQEMAARNCEELAERLSAATPGTLIRIAAGKEV
jgi:hypothetical protein